MLQVVPCFYANYSKISLLISANTYERHFVSKSYCTAHHNGKLCFLPDCSFHIKLLADTEELVQNWD